MSMTGTPAPLALGCMNFGRRTPEPEAARIVEVALEAGITTLDTANLYGDGESERIVGRLVRGRRGAVRIATKVGLARVGRGPEGLSPDRILAACDESLRRLGTDHVDLYYLHAPDPDTPPEQTLRALGALLETGRIRSWGVSNHAAWQILELTGLATRMGLPPPAVAQQLYNVLVRQLEVEYFPYTRRHPIHTTVYNPLAGGLLAGVHQLERAPVAGRFHKNPLYRRRYWQPALFAEVDALRPLAAAEGMSLVALAYAFVRHHPDVGSVLVGPGDVSHLRAAIDAVRPLSDETLRAIDALSVARLGDARYAR